MLEPDTRTLLLDVLRPPDGWSLGHALGTTFTLDLQALLVAPLAFAMFDWAVDDEGRPDPIALLEALRRYAERTTLFHQAGMIGVPQWQPLLVHLESCVVPVTPPNEHAIFHPKVWLLQFTRDDADPRYRLVVLSRNLTFDTSWDTVVTLEGTRRRKRRPSDVVGDFVSDLVDRAAVLSDDRRARLTAIADDVRHVAFDPPDGVDRVRFHAFGMRENRWPFPDDADDAVVISPFAGAATLQRMLGVAASTTLVSRPETLDEIGSDALAGFDRTLVLRSEVLEDDALTPERPPDDATSDRAESERTGLHGLHAKVFAFRSGDETTLFTGSANATGAAFGGNVELLVELVGDDETFPVDALLEAEKGGTAFADLCVDYTPAEPDRDGERARALSSLLDRTQRAVGRLPWVATATPHGEQFHLVLTSDVPLELEDGITAVHCWHASVGHAHWRTPDLRSSGVHLDLGAVSYDGLTSFFAFEVEASLDGVRDRTRFAVNARLVGAPEDRLETVISRLLRHRDDLLRYLLFLLADSGADVLDVIAGIGGDRITSDIGGWGLDTTALLERLLHALVHDPARLDRIAHLVADLRTAGRADELVPDGWDDVWAAIEDVRAEARP